MSKEEKHIKRISAKVAKCKVLFSEGLPCLQEQQMVLNATPAVPVAAVWGHRLVLGAMATADLYTAPARLQQLLGV